MQGRCPSKELKVSQEDRHLLAAKTLRKSCHSHIEEMGMGHNDSTILNIKAMLGAFLEAGLRILPDTQYTKAAIILQVTTVKKQ